MKRIYFDHSATTPVDRRVVEAMMAALTDKFGNSSSVHSFGREAKELLEKAREDIANVMNAGGDEIVFTSGGTEADNLALFGYVYKHRDKGRHIIVSNVEHPAVGKTAEELERLGFSVTYAPADEYGMVRLDTIKDLLKDETLLVSVMHVNNEVGTINNIGAIGRLLRERGVVFHTDAVQSFGKIPIDVEEMCIDLLSLSGHKIYGPKGIGALYVRKGIELQKRAFGGHHEHGFRAGTENIPGIAGLGKAAEICAMELEKEAAHLTRLRDKLHSLIASNVDDIILNGHTMHRLPGNLNLTFNGVEGEALLMALDLKGIGVSSGSACSSGSTQPSQALLNIGLTPQQAQSSLRITLGRDNTLEEIEYAAELIIENVNKFRAMSWN